jgi:hypothetical protein
MEAGSPKKTAPTPGPVPAPVESDTQPTTAAATTADTTATEAEAVVVAEPVVVPEEPEVAHFRVLRTIGAEEVADAGERRTPAWVFVFSEPLEDDQQPTVTITPDIKVNIEAMNYASNHGAIRIVPLDRKPGTYTVQVDGASFESVEGEQIESAISATFEITE